MNDPVPRPVIVAHCRGGFEPEAGVDLSRLAANAGDGIEIEAPSRRGFVVGRLASSDLRHWERAIERVPPLFVRSFFFGSGPHALIATETSGQRPDRLAPLLALIDPLRVMLRLPAVHGSVHAPLVFDSLRLETPDTNEGKQLSTLTRALAARLVNALRDLGALRATSADSASASAANVHVLFPDGAHAYVGASAAPWASRWPMGIPRLRMPGGAPSRSTLKLAEALVTFLGDDESVLMRAGMRAVDLGAAPGGWTWQLAHRGLRVVAVDNGSLKGAVRDDPLVTHVRADGLSWLPRRPVDWMVCDIVEQPSRIATLVARWISEGHARHAVFNLKLPMKKRYEEIMRCKQIIDDALVQARISYKISLRQLYHDREEVTGFIERSASSLRESKKR